MPRVIQIVCSIVTDLIAVIALGFLAPTAMAANVATCILDSVPSLQSDAAAAAAYRVCLQRYPGGFENVSQGDGRGWFGFDSGADCIVKKAANTQSRVAGNLITGACNRLYNEPKLLEFIDLIPPK